ncbi:hypothetical protein ACKWTF_010048 [Chironomus riparius]
MAAENENLSLNPNAIEYIPIKNEAVLSQRCRLIKDIKENTLKCIICLDEIKAVDQVWNCGACFQILHLVCMNKWKMVQIRKRGSYNCPACNIESHTPVIPLCFCGKVFDPPVTWNHLPHSCGDQCQKLLHCGHYCIFTCHPGPHIRCECRPPPKLRIFIGLLIYWILIGFKHVRYILSFEYFCIHLLKTIIESSIVILIIIERMDCLNDYFWDSYDFKYSGDSLRHLPPRRRAIINEQRRVRLQKFFRRRMLYSEM